MSSYYHAGDMSNPADLDLDGYCRVSCALALSMPFVEKVSFGDRAMLGIWIGHNAKEEDNWAMADILRAVRSSLDKFLSQYGLPSESIFQSKPGFGSERSKIMRDINPNSKTRGSRKRLQIGKAFWYVRDRTESRMFDPEDDREGNGLWWFDWCDHNEGILPREGEMPLANLYGGEFRRPIGKRYGRIRNDLLPATVSQS